MPTQGQRQDYLWRPNDNSATTMVRYELESEHWLNALTNTLNKGRSNVSSFASDLQGIGIILNFIVTLIFVILLTVSKLLLWLLGLTKRTPSTRVVERPKPISYAELKESIDSGDFEEVII